MEAIKIIDEKKEEKEARTLAKSKAQEFLYCLRKLEEKIKNIDSSYDMKWEKVKIIGGDNMDGWFVYLKGYEGEITRLMRREGILGKIIPYVSRRVAYFETGWPLTSKSIEWKVCDPKIMDIVQEDMQNFVKSSKYQHKQVLIYKESGDELD